EAAVEVLGMPALRVEVLPPAAPVEAGKKVVYTVRVVNHGSLAARGVAVSVSGVGDPPILRPIHGTGPGVGRADGQGLTFGKAERIDPRQTLTYQVEVAAE